MPNTTIAQSQTSQHITVLLSRACIYLKHKIFFLSFFLFFFFHTTPTHFFTSLPEKHIRQGIKIALNIHFESATQMCHGYIITMFSRIRGWFINNLIYRPQMCLRCGSLHQMLMSFGSPTLYHSASYPSSFSNVHRNPCEDSDKGVFAELLAVERVGCTGDQQQQEAEKRWMDGTHTHTHTHTYTHTLPRPVRACRDVRISSHLLEPASTAQEGLTASARAECNRLLGDLQSFWASDCNTNGLAPVLLVKQMQRLIRRCR